MPCKGFLGTGNPGFARPGGAGALRARPDGGGVDTPGAPPRTRVWAHRGRGGPGLENTLEAFAWARSIGADGVELDVHADADGDLVVHHDAVVPGSGPIAGLRTGDLPPQVPLLADALSACRGMDVNVEIKPPERAPAGGGQGAAEGEGGNLGGAGLERAAASLAGAVVSAAGATGWADRIVVSSFSTAVLDAAVAAGRAQGREVAVGWLVPLGSDPHGGAIDAAVVRGYRCVHPFVSWVDEALLHAARRAGLRLHVWTVNAEADLEAMVALGVDAVITDRPREALLIAGAG